MRSKGTAIFAAVLCAGTVATTAQAGLDNITGADLSGVFASQEFVVYGAYGYNINAIENFSHDGTALGSVDFALSGWNGYTGYFTIESYRVEIYSSAEAAYANLTGDVASITGASATDLGAIGDGGISNLMSIDLGGLDLAAGDYWIGVMPVNDFSAGGGQTGIMGSSVGDGSAAQANPDGGFGMPGGGQAVDGNLGYRLNAVPAPGALALLGLAGLVSRRRRR